MAVGSMISPLKTYRLPLMLFLASLVFQLIVIPSSHPPSRYDALGIERFSSIDEVTGAYEKLASKWKLGLEVPSSSNFAEIQYSFELLSNPLWKRNYDIFGIEEQHGVIDSVKVLYAGKKYWEIKVPLLEAVSFDFGDGAFHIISENFQHMFENNKALLINICSHGSKSCAEFSDTWRSIAALLEGVANIGMVELGDVQLARYFAQKRPTWQLFFSNGIPSLVAFSQDCRELHCSVRYDGKLSVDAFTDWFATSVLNLPRILYYTKESLGQNFLAKSKPHKVKVIFFSRTGERASPIVRHAAKNYWAHASFAFILWREAESLVWWNAFSVDSAPAIVILKDPGARPFVYHGSVNSSRLLSILEENKHQELPQLRSVTSMELGCDPRGYSRAGNNTAIWYCVILAGRRSPELDKIRGTLRRVQEIISSYGDELEAADKDQSWEPSAIAVKQKRLSFTWLDGEMQKDYCNFYLDAPSSSDACGPRRYPIDEPKLFIVRYKRNDSEQNLKVERRPQPIIGLFEKDVDHASQLVARYNGTEEPLQIIQWIAKIIKDGDSNNLPFYRTRTPVLIPEDAEAAWPRSAQRFVTTGKYVKQRLLWIISGTHLFLGPMLLLAALMSFSTIWLRTKSGVPVHSNQPIQQSSEGKAGERRRRRGELVGAISTMDLPVSSITDVEPKNAYQLSFSDSESE